MTAEIREMRKQDASNLYEIGQACGLGSWSLESYVNEYNNPIAKYLVVEAEGQVVGFAGIWCVVDEAQVMNVGILGKYRQNGLGTQLMAALIKTARAQGCSCMTLEVKETNVAAIRLYKKMGFSAASIRENYYPDHANGLMMRRGDLG
ncbi:ribosomal protein S18-alanine N-acetyltransferase [Eubacterium sp. 1001713B170207_170306_E7]|uniref:ribosomal protein S18-alanine N-acetyltransferase n=1 Tax=Eubacterium sp. 1001713B170207_170306_E7 TaxID=2787097 RepID=UPI00189A030A|nr:ribosomal protein S18-alanine N-acetyltransferase [Eubacterium sp. 1001713B170207_170306_E7]